MQKITIRILEEHEVISLVGVRLALESSALSGQVIPRGVEVIDSNGDMPHARRPHRIRSGVALRRYDFDQCAVRRFYKIIAGVFIGKRKLERRDVPIRKTLGVWRRDGEMFDTFKHYPGL